MPSIWLLKNYFLYYFMGVLLVPTIAGASFEFSISTRRSFALLLRREVTMGDQLDLFGSSTSRIQSHCPCCAFLPEDLFLPLNPNSAQDEDREIKTPIRTGNETHPISPVEALGQIETVYRKQESMDSKRRVLLVDTHGHPHLDRERTEAYFIENASAVPVVSLTCAVQERDWKTTLEYASKSDFILPGLGVHPWYLADLSSNWLEDLEALLLEHPSAVVGEIGLCKMARFVRSHPDGKSAALGIQRQVFKDQMRLAAKLKRPVSVHCVKQHGVFMSVLDELVNEGTPLPPAIGMHSFTGTAHHVRDILKWEGSHCVDMALPQFYFGFSHAVNYAMCSSDKSKRQGHEAVRAVPLDRLMAESDIHNTLDVSTATAGAVAYIAHALERPVDEVAERTASNGLSFLATAIRLPDSTSLMPPESLDC